MQPFFAILLHRKIKTQAKLAAVHQHNARIELEENVDHTRSHLNRSWDRDAKPIPDTKGWLSDQVKNRLSETGITTSSRKRKDGKTIRGKKVKEGTVLAIELLMTTSPEWWEAQGPEESLKRREAGTAWVKANIRYAQDRFGKANVIATTLHLDEATPHLHIIVTPIIDKIDGRTKDKVRKPTLDAKTMLGGVGREGLSNIVQDYGRQMAPFGLIPGQINHLREKEDRVRHIPIKKHQNIMADLREENANQLELLKEKSDIIECLKQSLDNERQIVSQLFKDAEETNKHNKSLKAALGQMIYIVQNGCLAIDKETIIIDKSAESIFNRIVDNIGRKGAEELAMSLIKLIEDGLPADVTRRQIALDERETAVAAKENAVAKALGVAEASEREAVSIRATAEREGRASGYAAGQAEAAALGEQAKQERCEAERLRAASAIALANADADSKAAAKALGEAQQMFVQAEEAQRTAQELETSWRSKNTEGIAEIEKLKAEAAQDRKMAADLRVEAEAQQKAAANAHLRAQQASAQAEEANSEAKNVAAYWRERMRESELLNAEAAADRAAAAEERKLAEGDRTAASKELGQIRDSIKHLAERENTAIIMIKRAAQAEKSFVTRMEEAREALGALSAVTAKTLEAAAVRTVVEKELEPDDGYDLMVAQFMASRERNR